MMSGCFISFGTLEMMSPLSDLPLPFTKPISCVQCVGYIQAQGCILNPKNAKAILAAQPTNNAGVSVVDITGDSGDNDSGKGKSYDDLKQERDKLRAENADLKRDIERLQINAMKPGSSKLLTGTLPLD